MWVLLHINPWNPLKIHCKSLRPCDLGQVFNGTGAGGELMELPLGFINRWCHVPRGWMDFRIFCRTKGFCKGLPLGGFLRLLCRFPLAISLSSQRHAILPALEDFLFLLMSPSKNKKNMFCGKYCMVSTTPTPVILQKKHTHRRPSCFLRCHGNPVRTAMQKMAPSTKRWRRPQRFPNQGLWTWTWREEIWKKIPRVND